MPIVVGIDGTGAFLDSNYAKDFAKSFVRQICPEGNPNKRYFRGPIGPGGGLTDAINAGYDYIKERQGWAGRDNRILLTGYSRGGLGVLVIADKLKKLNLKVAAMLLFDAVDRHVVWDMPVVPENVETVLHLRRNPQSNSRNSFGNCGTSATKSTSYTEQYFMCTHGGVGGTFWPRGENAPTERIYEGFPDNRLTNITYEQDERVSGEVWKAASPFVYGNKFI